MLLGNSADKVSDSNACSAEAQNGRMQGFDCAIAELKELHDLMKLDKEAEVADPASQGLLSTYY